MIWLKNFGLNFLLICGMKPIQMTITQISARLVELITNKAFVQALEELYDEHASSTEPNFHPNPKTEGLPGMIRKEQHFLDSIQTWEGFEVSEALISKDHFSIRMYSKLQLKSNAKLEIDELIVYQVKRGKIIHETYYYDLS